MYKKGVFHPTSPFITFGYPWPKDLVLDFVCYDISLNVLSAYLWAARVCLLLTLCGCIRCHSAFSHPSSPDNFVPASLGKLAVWWGNKHNGGCSASRVLAVAWPPGGFMKYSTHIFVYLYSTHTCTSMHICPYALA